MPTQILLRAVQSRLVTVSVLRTLFAFFVNYLKVDVTDDVIGSIEVINAFCLTIWFLYVVNAVQAIRSFCYIWGGLGQRRQLVSFGCAPIWLYLSTHVAQKLLFRDSEQTPVQYYIVSALAILWGLPVFLGIASTGVGGWNQSQCQDVLKLCASNVIHLVLYSLFLTFASLRILSGCPIGGKAVPLALSLSAIMLLYHFIKHSSSLSSPGNRTETNFEKSKSQLVITNCTTLPHCEDTDVVILPQRMSIPCLLENDELIISQIVS